MKPYINALVEYFRDELLRLKTMYNWEIPKIDGFDESGETGYSANVNLKKYFNSKWCESDFSGRMELADLVISKWGKVRGNKSTTLRSYVDELYMKDPSTPIKGVASYSKLFAISDMERFAIYDSRVAVCLNSVQWNAKVKDGVAFNYIPGRNNVTGNDSKKVGFTFNENFTVKSLVEFGWSSITKDETYSIYIETLNECLLHLNGYKIYDLEMVLFANAEFECMKAIRTIY